MHSERYFCSSATYCTSKKHCFWAYKTCCCSLRACTAQRQQKAANASLLESRSLLQTANFHSNILGKNCQAANGGHGPQCQAGSATASP